MKVCKQCWMPCMPDTEHKIEGKTVCHDCWIEAGSPGETLVAEAKGKEKP